MMKRAGVDQQASMCMMPSGLTLLLQGEDLPNVTFIKQRLTLECGLSKHLEHFDIIIASVESQWEIFVLCRIRMMSHTP